MAQGKIKWQKNITRPLTPLKVTTLFDGLEKIGLRDSLVTPEGEKQAWYFNEEEFDQLVKNTIKARRQKETKTLSSP